ncbi:hypothetical protein EVAR_14624_1 [Eumeta japonica]|uniref:Uncharacterized protein n=1 Tax=Eumeta variegata TaxID=151549 RepID=A0A4C1U1Z0_EUMVA|nr:hypothetical protein EVAR_14624_1 [Eumeta japonica]
MIDRRFYDQRRQMSGIPIGRPATPPALLLPVRGLLPGRGNARRPARPAASPNHGFRRRPSRVYRRGEADAVGGGHRILINLMVLVWAYDYRMAYRL